MLDHAERDGDAAGLTAIARTAVSELDDLVSPAMHHQIGTFCRRYGLGPNFVEVIRDNPLALARYKL
jgi:hypothetical protein